MIKFGSVCSGIEAASVAWEPLGWKASWLSEIDKFPSKVLKHHFPDIKNLGDMTHIERLLNEKRIESPDVFVGGTPCQAFSVTGLRKGLDDERGKLSLTFCRIADAIDRNRREQGRSPSAIVWENVPGVLNSKDNAFGCFLGELSGEGRELVTRDRKWRTGGFIDGKERWIAWRVLDAQYFGVPQRRRRVFVVASSREGGIDPRRVLLDTKTQGDLPKRIRSRERRGLTTSTCGTCGNANSRGITIVSERGWRRLTVTEEERRQGFPDGWTYPGEGTPKTKQYKALGNSMAVPVMRWIGERIDNLLKGEL